MVRVYSEYYTRKYYAPYVSFGSCCCVISFLVLLVLPFLLAFATNTFWEKTNFYHEQPLVRPNGHVFIQVSTTEGSKYYSSIQKVQSQYKGLSLAPILEATANDYDSDGINDLMMFRAQIPVQTAKVRRVNIAFGFDYELVDIGKVWLKAGTFSSFASAEGISSISSTGTLTLRQREPLKVGSEKKELYPNENIFALFEGRTFTEVLEIYTLRNQSISFGSTPIIMPYGDESQLSIEVNVRIPKQKIVYTPQMLEVLKFAWMQYMSFLLPIYAIIYSGLLWVMYRNGVIDSKAVEDPIISTFEKGRKRH